MKTKLFKNFLVLLVLVISLTCLTACGEMKINYNLVGNDTFANSTITNINNDPARYKDKTLKVWGKFKGSSGYYTLNENNTCCRWQFEVRMDSGVSTPKSGANVTVAGKCVVNKVNGITGWYLLVSEIN